MGLESNRNKIAKASQSHTLPSPMSQRSNQSLSKSVSVPPDGKKKKARVHNIV